MRENFVVHFLCEKHLDEQAKKRYTISTSKGRRERSRSRAVCVILFEYHLDWVWIDRRTYLMAEEIKNPNTEEE